MEMGKKNNEHDCEGSKHVQKTDVMEKMKLEHELMEEVEWLME